MAGHGGKHVVETLGDDETPLAIGKLIGVDGLGDKLRVAMDAGARRVLIPTENSRDFAQLPAEVLDKLRIEFYSEPFRLIWPSTTSCAPIARPSVADSKAM